MKKILLIEDDINLGSTLVEFLQRSGFEVVWKQDLTSANLSLDSDINLILLDWNLPDGTGLDWLKTLKNKSLAVIMLTARSSVTEKVLGLEFGANDYITKPFEPQELLARIRVQLRDRHETTSLMIEENGIKVNVESHEVFFNSQKRDLTNIEFKLLLLFIKNPNKVFSREQLLDLVWEQRSVSTRTIDVHLAQLRQKFDPTFFQTLHAVGYRFLSVKGETK